MNTPKYKDFYSAGQWLKRDIDEINKKNLRELSADLAKSTLRQVQHPQVNYKEEISTIWKYIDT